MALFLYFFLQHVFILVFMNLIDFHYADGDMEYILSYAANVMLSSVGILHEELRCTSVEMFSVCS